MGKVLDKIWRRRARPDSREEYERRRELRGYTAQGQEMDPVPIAPPIGYKKQPSMVDHIRELIRSERLREEAMREDLETFDEADDFGSDDDEDYVPLSGYESEFDPPGVVEAKRRYEEAHRPKEPAVATPAAPELPIGSE